MSSDAGAASGRHTSPGFGAETERIGIYWKPSLWALARSAYVADLDHDPGSPDAFVSWLGRALEQHAERTPAQRVALAGDLQLQNVTGSGFTRSHPLPVRTIELIEEAVIADRRELGRVVSRSAFTAEAVVAAAQAARERLGRPLPPPPARLSNRPPRRPTRPVS
ncbi:hypothetical protein [Nocardioides psychrotolerans]|uniref:hypothetical protein n=1 Tax=Nocardioides psychrotolerans TaxID=1005945 RepID=UPI003137A5AB